MANSFLTQSLSSEERERRTIKIALLSIDFIISSIVRSPDSKQYLQPIITQYFASNKSEIWP